jgi:hypothetical protein
MVLLEPWSEQPGEHPNNPRNSRMITVAAGLLILSSMGLQEGQARPAAGDTIPPGPGDTLQTPLDTYRDPGVRVLLARAREARARDVEGIESYEALMRERIYVGISSTAFRRERGLFQQQRAARYRWSSDGERVIQWLGARRTIPLVVGNAELSSEIQDEIREDLAYELAREFEPGPLAFDPWDDRIVFGDSWAIHPLSDSAGAHYRFSSGDTLRVSLPGDQGEITMVEARVEPRRRDLHLLAGSLWFDRETGALVRASYKPARPFDLDLDEPEDAEEVPGFLKPIRGEIDYITIDYSLHEFEFWLPRRFGIEGELQVGRFLRVPLTLEWTVGQYVVNEAESLIPGAADLPPGWSRSERRVQGTDESEPYYVTVIVPPGDSLETSGALPSPDLGTSPTAFSDAELRALRQDLDALIPNPLGYDVRLAYGLREGMTRYNRVEALSTGVAAEFDVTARSAVGGSVRLGFDLEPNASLFLRRGTADRGLTVGAYRRLNYVNEREDPFRLTASALSLAFGYEDAQFYRSWGGELVHRSRGRLSKRHVRVFAEHQWLAEKTTDFYLTGAITGSNFPDNLRAEEANLLGGEVGLDWQSGLDPRSLIASGSLRLEGALGRWGDTAPACEDGGCLDSDSFDYQRLWASTAVTHPLFLGLSGALEVGAGAAWGRVPVQREFYLGGHSTLRGFNGGTRQIFGTSAWMGRLEIASGLPIARLSAFSDVGWAGPREDFTFEDPYVNVGLGGSLMDGIFRFDIARAVRRGSDWRIHFYLDGLF